MVRKTLKFNFVTSAHGVFETGGGLRYLTNWGDKTVAVSDDIRRYLRESYGVAGQNIKVTINGIDTEKFSSHTSSEKIEREFGLNPDAPVICHVSRLDDETVMMAEKLIDSVIRIDQEIRCSADHRRRRHYGGITKTTRIVDKRFHGPESGYHDRSAYGYQ